MHTLSLHDALPICLDHAWFVCFTPSDKSELLIVAFAQNTPGGGSVHALPMAREILKVWNENN